MLEGLDAVDWGGLTHAYGEATDVPDQIRALAASDKAGRTEALGDLFGNIWHQGTVYQATAFAVPFLIELLAGPEIAGKEGILQLLACIAEGTSYLEAHAGLLDVVATGADPDQEQADREEHLARELGWVRAAVEAVEAGVGAYLRLLADDEADVRIFAAYVLDHCRGQAARVVPGLVDRIATEADARVRAALILAIGSLRAGEGEPAAIPGSLAERLGPGEHPVVRLATAMCGARWSPALPAPEILDILAATIGPAWDDVEGLPWCDGDAAVSVGAVLDRYPEARLRFLLSILDGPAPKARAGARYAIEQLCQERRSITRPAAAALGERLRMAGDPADRRGIAEIFSRLGSAAEVAAGPLGELLDDADPQTRGHAAVALARPRDPRAIPVLIALLDPGEGRLFSKVAHALGEYGAAASVAVPALLAVLDRPAPRDAMLAHNRPIQVAIALGRIGPAAGPAVPALIALMKSHAPTCRAVAKSLGQIGDPAARAAIPHLKKLLRSGDELARIPAAWSLWELDRRADDVLPVLVAMLRPGGTNPALAAEALAAMGEAARAAVPALRLCLEAPAIRAMWARLHAARALWRIDRDIDETVPVLIGLLREPGAVGAYVATLAAKTLGEMGGAARAALPVLRAAGSGDLRPFGGIVDEIVADDDAFCAAVAGALRRIEGPS